MSGSLAVMIAAASLFANFGALACGCRRRPSPANGAPRDLARHVADGEDFWLTGVGAGAFERGMLVYQEGSRQFFFNHAHDEYLQLVVEGGLLLAVPATIALLAGMVLIVYRLRSDRTPIFWLRAGAISGLIAVAIQSIWDTGLRTPANGVLFAVIAAIALHEPRPAHDGRARHGSSRSITPNR